MSDEKLTECLAQMLRILAEEVAGNKKLATRLAAPWQAYLAENISITSVPSDKPTRRKKATTKEPPALDPFMAFIEGGSVGLIKALENVEVQECKVIISHYALDPSRSYVRWRKKERLVELIVQRVKAVTNKGEVFKE